MNSVSMTFIGKERFLKKDGSGYWYKIHYISAFSDRKKEEGCMGSEGGNCFVNEECWYGIKPENVGQEFDFIYGTNEFKRAEVIGLKFIEDKSK